MLTFASITADGTTVTAAALFAPADIIDDGDGVLRPADDAAFLSDITVTVTGNPAAIIDIEAKRGQSDQVWRSIEGLTAPNTYLIPTGGPVKNMGDVRVHLSMRWS